VHSICTALKSQGMCGLCVTEFSTGLSIYESQQFLRKTQLRPSTLPARCVGERNHEPVGDSALITFSVASATLLLCSPYHASDGFALNRHGEFCQSSRCVRGYSFRPQQPLATQTSFDQKARRLLDEYRCHLQLAASLYAPSRSFRAAPNKMPLVKPAWSHYGGDSLHG